MEASDVKEISSNIGLRIKSLLTLKCIARKELAKELNLSYNTLTKKLNGKRQFKIDELFKIKDFFNLDFETFTNMFFSSDFSITKITKK